MKFYTALPKDFELIRKSWGNVFHEQHPMVLNKDLMSWFYSSDTHLSPSGFRYSVDGQSHVNAFIGYKAIQWSGKVKEVWICGFGAKSSSPGTGFLLLRDFLKKYSQYTICVVGFIPELEKLYTSMGFVIQRGFRNLAKVGDSCSKTEQSFSLLSSSTFFEYYSDVIDSQFKSSYFHLFVNHIAWTYFVVIGHQTAFFVRKESGSICRIVMAYSLSNKGSLNLTDIMVNELYCFLAGHFKCEYVDFICNVNLHIGSDCSGVELAEDDEFPGYFCPRAPYIPLKFAIKYAEKSTDARDIYFKSDGDQERSNGKVI